eukprot:502536-Amphidinium_carterae.2
MKCFVPSVKQQAAQGTYLHLLWKCEDIHGAQCQYDLSGAPQCLSERRGLLTTLWRRRLELELSTDAAATT